MIKRIDFIRDFGIFKNFIWNNVPDLEEFKEKNIFYGWNYSGKTTLSRLFSSLRDKEIHGHYKNANFKISTDTGQVDSSSLTTFPDKVLVFNSEYCRDNLRWEFDEHINAIFFEVGDNAKITEQIEKISKEIDSINGTDSIKGSREKYQGAINTFNDFENIFTQEAGRIKNDSFSSLIEFNKGHLKRIRDKIIADLNSNIITKKDDLSLLSRVVKIENPKPEISNIIFESSFKTIVEQTDEVLKSVPAQTEIIEILDKKNTAYQWVKEGLALNSPEQECLFCGNTITKNRYDELNRYYENEASKLREKVSTIFKLIFNEETLVNTINLPTSVNDFNDGFQTEFEKKKKEIDKDIKKYKFLLNQIKTTLTQKINDSIYSAVEITFSEVEINSLQTKLALLNDLIDKNNDFAKNFETQIEIEREKFKNHLVATFLKQSKYLNKKTANDKALVQIEKLNLKIANLKTQIDRLNAKKESDAEGCSQFNSFVQSFLSRKDIQIILNTTTKKFNLMRGTDLAINLSEGEKMAISFSHFLVNLRSIEQKGDLKNHILYIDDPISSLDSNHIFQINSLLKEMLFTKIPDPNQPRQMMWDLKCKQIFLSTHNFEFFNLLKEMPKQHGYSKKESRYFISRKVTEATIEKLPNVFNTFSSEYHFLFGEILSFKNEVNKSASPKLLTIPNIIRRFVEMYTLTKYPSNDEVDARAEVVFGKKESKRILKLLHYFSHFNSIDRIHTHSGFASDIEHACDDLINLIKANDEMHYNALEAALN